jgi:hypothetical protein
MQGLSWVGESTVLDSKYMQPTMGGSWVMSCGVCTQLFQDQGLKIAISVVTNLIYVLPHLCSHELMTLV